jgi:hypothetical protein
MDIYRFLQLEECLPLPTQSSQTGKSAPEENKQPMRHGAKQHAAQATTIRAQSQSRSAKLL